MKGRLSAFTLAELLVVVAIIAVLAAMLFPVLNTARNAAKTAVCISNFKQVHTAVQLYSNDYDTRYMPVNYRPGEPQFQNPTDDRTWVQLILPYVNTFSMFRCPEDNNDRPRREATFDQDLVPGDTYSQYYTASTRTNLGFNFIYFSPSYLFGDQWASMPKTESDVENPEQTYLFIDSVWQLNPDGTPTGGGSWLVVPPCRYDKEDQDTFVSGDTPASNVFTNQAEGWETGMQSSALRYGGAWPWHGGGRRMTTITASGTARSLTPDQVAQGCDVQPNWGGQIDDPDRYAWDLR